jgi:hypothetical protein
MWPNTISFYIFFKEIRKIRLELSHKGEKQTLCENPTLNAIQSLLRSITQKFQLQICSKMFVFSSPLLKLYTDFKKHKYKVFNLIRFKIMWINKSKHINFYFFLHVSHNNKNDLSRILILCLIEILFYIFLYLVNRFLVKIINIVCQKHFIFYTYITQILM